MKAENRVTALLLLAFKYESSGKAWDPLEAGFNRLLTPLHDQHGLVAVDYAVATVTFLNEMIPTILRRHAELLSPVPSVHDAWSEVSRKMGLPGNQTLSHPMIAAAVRDIGGLTLLWHEYQFMRKPLTDLKDRFAKVYEARAKSHCAEVTQAVAAHGSIAVARRAAPHLFPVVPEAKMLPACTLPEVAHDELIEAGRYAPEPRCAQNIPAEVVAKLRESGFDKIGTKLAKSQPALTAKRN